jgi:mannose/fructose/N-acetylgalactosamine-specific phosphotransferase system component IID
MSMAQKLGVGLLYAAIAVSGAVYAVFELHQTDRLLHFFKELMPALLVLMLVLVIYGLVQAVTSVLQILRGASRAAHATLHMNYGRK